MGDSKRAKRPPSVKKSGRTSRPVANGAVESRLRKLREFYERGLRLREKPRIRWAEQDEDATSGRAELLRKARAFADPEHG